MKMNSTKTVGLVGGGVIGAGWAARFLMNGADVAVYDPDPEIGRKIEAVLANARRAWGKLVPADLLPPEGRLKLAASPVDAVAGADFVQESLPEREDLKRRILAEIDAALPGDVVIGSSTSGLLPSRLQADMAHPERLVVGHPFNPVYLLPLVEICGGEKTSAATKARAEAVYRAIGMHPLHVRKEIDGFIADRLLEALWREALWLVEDGIATTAEIDDAVRYGAGLRWSFMGTFLIYRLAGGEAGMRHFLAQFGPALKLPWTKLEAPELTDGLVERVATQSDDQAAGVDIRALERKRDDCLVGVLKALKAEGYAAGATVGDYAAALAARRTQAAADPLRLHEATVEADWIDYNGHMTEHRYAEVFAGANDAILAHVGLDAAYLATGRSFYTVETHIRHLAEAKRGERLRVTTQVIGADGKRLHVFHRLHRASDEALIATGEHLFLHVDQGAGKAVPAAPEILARMARLAADHAGLPRPEGAGRFVGEPR
jgi:carnitine 3-dehydrogenase